MDASPIHMEKKKVDSPLCSLNNLEAPLGAGEYNLLPCQGTIFLYRLLNMNRTLGLQNIHIF